MKKINLILAFIIAIAIVGCNPKKDRNIENNDSLEATNTDDLDDLTDFDNDSLFVTDLSDNSDSSDKVVDTTEAVTNDTKKEPVMVENEDGSVKKVPETEIKDNDKEHVKKFYVIAGSFQEINNAVTLRKFFKERGYPAMILYPYHGYNRVATGSYPNRAAAEKDIKKFRAMNLSYDGEKIEYWLLWR